MASGRCGRPTLGEVARDGNPNGLRPPLRPVRVQEQTGALRVENGSRAQAIDTMLSSPNLRAAEPRIITLAVVRRGHTSAVSCVVALPHGRALSASSDSTLRLWDLATSECVRTFEGHSDWVIHHLDPAGQGTSHPLLPCVAVLDANREVLRVARRRERHLWHLVLCGHVIGEFTVQPQQFLVYRGRDRIDAL